MAQGPYGLPLDCNVKIRQEIEASKTFIYCIKLPGFECHTTLNQPTHQSQGVHFLQPDFQYMPQQPVALKPSLFEYTMIKVGVSKNPARRLHEIMRSIEGFGVAAAETQFKFIRESDPSSVTVEKGKSEDNVIFIQQCHSVKRPNKMDCESAIRQRIGRQELSKRFRDEFKKSIFDRLEGDGESYVEQVGMTEWVLASTTLIGQIQQNMRRKIWKLSLPGCPSGEEFLQDLIRQKSQSQTQDKEQVFYGFKTPHKVKIKLPPTSFAYDQDILPLSSR